MIFQREQCKFITAPKASKISSELARVRSSFATITSENGAYLQAAGGPGLFLLEHRNADGQHYRAFQDQPVVQFPNGTVLSFSAGQVQMAQADWFLLKQVAEVFSAFLSTQPWPAYVHWKKITVNYEKAG